MVGEKRVGSGALRVTGTVVFALLCESVCALTMTFQPETYSSTDSYHASATVSDGRIFFPPGYRTTKALVVHPDTGSSMQISTGVQLPSNGNIGSVFYQTAIVAPNGKIYCAPYYARKVLVIDPATETTYQLSQDLGSDAFKYYTSVLAPNGMIYAPPGSSSTQVLKIDPTTDTSARLTSLSSHFVDYTTAIMLGSKMIAFPRMGMVWVTDTTDDSQQFTFAGNDEWASGSYSPIHETSAVAGDGRIFAAPAGPMSTYSWRGPTFVQGRVAVYDPVSNTFYQMAESYIGYAQYRTSSTAPDGRVFAPPHQATKVLVMDHVTTTSYQLATTVSNGYRTSLTHPDGKIYCAGPNLLLVIDPVTDSLTEISHSVSYVETMATGGASNAIFIPPFLGNQQVLAIDIVMPTSSPTTSSPTTVYGANTAVIGEMGTTTTISPSGWKTVSLQHNYASPIVLVSDPTLNGADQSVIRIRNIGSNAFEISLQEAPDKDNAHGFVETVHYLVMEAGSHTLADGSRIAAWRTESLHSSTQRISFPSIFARDVTVRNTFTHFCKGTHSVDLLSFSQDVEKHNNL